MDISQIEGRQKLPQQLHHCSQSVCYTAIGHASLASCPGVCASIKEPVTSDILLHVVENERWVLRQPAVSSDQTQQLMPPPKKMPRTEPQPS